MIITIIAAVWLGLLFVVFPAFLLGQYLYRRHQAQQRWVEFWKSFERQFANDVASCPELDLLEERMKREAGA